MIGCRLVPTSVDTKCVLSWKDCMLRCTSSGERTGVSEHISN